MLRFLLVLMFFFSCVGEWSFDVALKALMFSVLSSIIAYVIFKKLPNSQHVCFKLNLHLVFYVFWLLREVIVSSFQMIKIVLMPNIEISPEIFDIRLKRGEVASSVIYANSITLTPGTVTTNLTNGKISVYAITAKHKKSLIDSDMYKKIIRSQRK